MTFVTVFRYPMTPCGFLATFPERVYPSPPSAMATPRIDFLKTAFRDLAQTGSVWESSRFLVQKLLQPVDWPTVVQAVELGTGNGVITEAILQVLPVEAHLTAWEINPEFAEQTLHRVASDPRCQLQTRSAEFLSEVHAPGSVDVVISSLPLSLLPEEVRERILHAIHGSLREGGLYIQYQYAPTRLMTISRLFRRVRLDHTLWNIPPAFVYTCTK